jgi:hypothetical protein
MPAGAHSKPQARLSFAECGSGTIARESGSTILGGKITTSASKQSYLLLFSVLCCTSRASPVISTSAHNNCVRLGAEAFPE